MEEIDEILNRYGIGELLVLSAMQVKRSIQRCVLR